MRDGRLNGKTDLEYPEIFGTPEDLALDTGAVVEQEDPLRVLREWWWMVLAVTVVVTTLAAVTSLMQTPTYTASTTLVIGREDAVDEAEGVPSSIVNDVQGLQQLTTTMAQVVQSRVMMEEVVQSLDLRVSAEALQQNVVAEQVEETQIIDVWYTDTDPERAQVITNAIGEEFSQELSRLNPSGHAVSATILDEATLPEEGSGFPIPLRNIALGLALGLMLGVGLAFLMDYLNSGWRSPEDLEKATGIPSFSAIPRFKTNKEEG